MAGRRIKFIARLFLFGCLLLIAAAVWTGMTLNAPFDGGRGSVLIELPRGAGTRAMAATLEQQGVIRSQWQFMLVRLLRPRATLQAGEYQFAGPASVFQVFDKIARGQIFYYEVTIPEGSNLFDIAGILEARQLPAAKDFRKMALDPSLIRDLAPQAPSLEGYLFPATYRLTRHTTAKQFCKDMTDRFRRAWKTLNATGGNVHRTVTLASLVEKETGVAEERPMVASVFHNRLEQNIKLDCDPTTIYAALLQGRYRGTIYRSDLNSTHPYNTYQHAGLPPGAIANPGLKSLEAALRPAATDYLFFVAKTDGSGGHIFSSSIDAHNRAVAEYRRGQQKGKAPTPPSTVDRNRKSGSN
jgi:UPF0755 protein